MDKLEYLEYMLSFLIPIQPNKFYSGLVYKDGDIPCYDIYQYLNMLEAIMAEQHVNRKHWHNIAVDWDK